MQYLLFQRHLKGSEIAKDSAPEKLSGSERDWSKIQCDGDNNILLPIKPNRIAQIIKLMLTNGTPSMLLRDIIIADNNV